jgi:hypothetical protein
MAGGIPLKRAIIGSVPMMGTITFSAMMRHRTFGRSTVFAPLDSQRKNQMSQPDLRRHERILVPGGQAIRAVGNRDAPPLEGIVTVIGLGGMFIRTSGLYPAGSLLNIVLTCSSLSFESVCIVRNSVPNGIGVELTEVTPENEQKLKTLLIQLKA